MSNLTASSVFNFSAKDSLVKSRPIGTFISNVNDGLVIQESDSQRITWVHGKLQVIDFKKSTDNTFTVQGINTESKYKRFVDKAVTRYTLQTLINQGCIKPDEALLALAQFFISVIRNSPSVLDSEKEQEIFTKAVTLTLQQITPQSSIWKLNAKLTDEYPTMQVFDDWFDTSAIQLLARIYFNCKQNNIALPELAQSFILQIAEKMPELMAEVESEIMGLLQPVVESLPELTEVKTETKKTTTKKQSVH